jgi:hypothetical protein
MRGLFSSLFLLAAVPQLHAQPTPSARQQYESLAKNLLDAKTSKNWPAYTAAAIDLQQLLNSSPDSFIRLARAYVFNNDLPAAIRTLQQYVAMGQFSDEVRTSADFAPLRALPEFAAIQAAMEANQSPVSRGSTEFTMDSFAGQITEDVAYDSASTKTFFFTTVLGKKILAYADNGHTREFASSPDGWPFLALKIDSAHGMLWATEVALRDFYAVPESAQGKSAILCYALASGKLLRRIDGPASSALGDFTLTTNGDLVLSDNEGGGIYFLSRESSTLERLDSAQFVSPQTPALAADDNLIFIPDYARGIAVLNRATREIRWLNSQNRFALSGIDGLYYRNGKLFAVQNGSSPERVVIFKLDSALTRITGESVIERATSFLGDPTHGVFVGNDFYYISNSGWNLVDDHGTLRPDTKASAPHLMRFHRPNRHL